MACGTCGGGRRRQAAAVTSGDLAAAETGADGRVPEAEAVYFIKQADGSVLGDREVDGAEVGADYFERFQDAAVALRLSGSGTAVVRKVKKG